MKKRTIISLLLVACMATMCFVGGTFAKYTSTVSAKDAVRVASWNVKASDLAGTGVFAAEAATVDLFQTYEDTNVDVDGEGDEIVIAPGTTGSFKFTLTNASEVTVRYAINYTVDEKEVPIQWSVDGGTTWTTDLADVAASQSTELAFGAAAQTITVQWKWAFEANTIETGQSDVEDTKLGAAQTLAEPTVTIAVTFTQVD